MNMIGQLVAVDSATRGYILGIIIDEYYERSSHDKRLKYKIEWFGVGVGVMKGYTKHDIEKYKRFYLSLRKSITDKQNWKPT